MEEELTREARRGLGEHLLETSSWTRKTKRSNSKQNKHFFHSMDKPNTRTYFFSGITLVCVSCLFPGASFSLMRTVLSLVGPGVGHRKRGICMTAGQCWSKHAHWVLSQWEGGQKEGTRCSRVRGEGKGSLNTGISWEHTSFWCHCKTLHSHIKNTNFWQLNQTAFLIVCSCYKTRGSSLHQTHNRYIFIFTFKTVVYYAG